MQELNAIAVIGCTGKAGQYLLKTLLEKKIRCNLLVRDVHKISDLPPFIKLVNGDVRDFDSLMTLLTGTVGLISMLGHRPGDAELFSRAAANILKAMDATRTKRYVVLAGLNVEVRGDQKGPNAAAATQWMKDNFPQTCYDRQQELRLLEASHIDWTLVRLPRIVQTSDRHPVTIDLQDCRGESISATDLAEYVLQIFFDSSFYRKAPFLAS